MLRITFFQYQWNTHVDEMFFSFSAVFGVELTTFVKMEGTKVPSVIKDCIEEIEKRGKLINPQG